MPLRPIQVSPAVPAQDSAYNRSGNAKAVRQFLMGDDSGLIQYDDLLDVILGQFGVSDLLATRGGCQRKATALSSLVPHVSDIRGIRRQPEMAIPLVGDPANDVCTDVIMANAEFHIAGVADDSTTRDGATRSAFPCEVMGEAVLSIVLQVPVAARLSGAGPEVTLTADDEGRPRHLGIHHLRAVETPTRAESRLRMAGPHAGSERRSARRAGTLDLRHESTPRGAAPGDGDNIARASRVNYTAYQEGPSW